MLSSSIRNTTANAASRLSSITSQVRNSSTITMKEAIVSAGPSVKIIDSPVPKPNADQVVTKVIFSGSNPKDWKISSPTLLTSNAGTTNKLTGSVQT